MCTAFAIHDAHAGGYRLVFNRDELLSRAIGRPPKTRAYPNGVSAISPRDPDAGGTWIAVTSRGEAFALLNNYRLAQSFEPRPPVVSRGAIIDWLCARPSEETVEDVFVRQQGLLPSVRPFRLLVHTPDGGHQWHWTGERLTHDMLAPLSLAISSGTHQDEATRDRTAAMADLLGDVDSSASLRWDLLAERMAGHEPYGPTALCMHRHDGQTVSQTVVTVTPLGVEMHYKAGPPCSTRTWLSLALRRTTSSP